MYLAHCGRQEIDAIGVDFSTIVPKATTTGEVENLT